MVDPDAKRAALLLIARGMVTVPEAAQLAGVSRQLVHAWCKAKGLSTTGVRKERLAVAWRRALRRR